VTLDRQKPTSVCRLHARPQRACRRRLRGRWVRACDAVLGRAQLLLRRWSEGLRLGGSLALPYFPCGFTVGVLLLVTGCQPGASGVVQQNPAFAQQQQQQFAQLQSRAASLDQDNQDLQALVAQLRQQNRLKEDELAAVRDQLRSVNEQLADLRSSKENLEEHTQAMTASIQRRAQASIRANNSLIGRVDAIRIPGVEVRQDNDLVRIELPGEDLFHPGSAVLKPGAMQIIDRVMADVVRNYPDQVLGIEGHTDSDPINTPEFPSNHHLSIARATAVYDHLVRHFNLPRRQLFVVGHGANYPVVSNATAAGKARNRRVELVVYPESYRQ